jgi:hypothetical protein
MGLFTTRKHGKSSKISTSINHSWPPVGLVASCSYIYASNLGVFVIFVQNITNKSDQLCNNKNLVIMHKINNFLYILTTQKSWNVAILLLKNPPTPLKKLHKKPLRHILEGSPIATCLQFKIQKKKNPRINKYLSLFQRTLVISQAPHINMKSWTMISH